MGLIHIMTRANFRQIFRVGEIKTTIIPGLFIAHIHNTTQNVCLRKFFKLVCIKCK